MKTKFSILILIICIFGSCTHKGNPKPREYFRLVFPEKKYQTFDKKYPYTFEYPTYANVTDDLEKNTELYWININFPNFKANIHVSYKTVENNIEELLEDSRTLVYKHVVKADAIDEKIILNDSLKIYGILFYIKGNAATPAQFYITDSVKHFFRGSLYFNVYPNKDSLAPVIKFLTADIEKMVETFNWTKIK